MIAALTGEELVLVLGAYSAFVLGAFAALIKFVLDTRRAASATNTAVNTCKGHRRDADDDVTLRELVEETAGDLRALRAESFDRHKTNVARLDGLTHRMTTVERDLKKHIADVDRNKGEGS